MTTVLNGSPRQAAALGMTRSPFLVTALDSAAHDRSCFDSGTPALDRYLREQVSQDIHRRVAACFVAVTPEVRVTGYYTLATASVPLTGLPVLRFWLWTPRTTRQRRSTSTTVSCAWTILP